jgi:hypothetical protein
MNITVPEELKERMDAMGGLVNWSAVACAAFEKELVAVKTRMMVAAMSDVIERLKASQESQATDDYKRGHFLGGEWAKTQAEAAGLKRLAACNESCSPIEWDQMFDTGPGPSTNSAAERLAWVIRPDLEGDRDRTDAFWEKVASWGLDGQLGESEFLKGFAEGALEVWDIVKDHM